MIKIFFLLIAFFPFSLLALEIIAHRGGPEGQFEDSSFEAFENSLKQGQVILESDLHLTADNQVILSHDPSFKTQDEKEIIIKDHTLQQLTQYKKWVTILDVGEWIKKYPYLHFHLEIKFATPWQDETKFYKPRDQIVKIVSSYMMGLQIMDKVHLSSFDVDILRQLRQQSPRFKLKYLFRGSYYGNFLADPQFCRSLCFWPNWSAALDVVKEINAEALSINYKLLTHPIMKLFAPYPKILAKDSDEARAFQIFVWTVNDVETLKKLEPIAVDAIITDYPSRFKK